MNYEKKYKEALEKASKLRVQNPFDTVGQMVEHIFPELKESEDERIRKKLIHLVKKSHEQGGYALHKWEADEMLAWLENQKEYESTDFEYVWDRTDCGDLTSALDKYSEEAIINMCHAWYDKGIELERKSWLEKQCYTKKDVDDAYLKGICNTKHELEKQGDQKSVDKEYTFKSIPRLLDMIEPTDRAKSYCKKLIDSLQTEGYSVDAKIVGECLKQMNGEKVAMAVTDTEKQDKQKPQRMVSAEAKEALYDKPTDEEMKELLRTEYEKGRADTIAEMKSSWSEEDEKKPNGGIVLEDFNDGNGFYKVNLAYLNEEQVEEIEELVKRWGCQPKENEDESIISDLLDYFDEDKCLKHEVNDIVKWLKTIKPQPKQKLSDNEKKMLCNLIAYINNRTDLISEVKDTYVSWLKSLKDRVVPQPKHKWSIEDERVIAIINNALTESNTPSDDYDKVYDWLESLRKRIGG